MVLLAPFLALPDQPVPMKTVRRITSLLCMLGLGRLLATRRPRPGAGFDSNTLTSDPARYRRNTQIYDTLPDLALEGPTVRWLRAASIAVEAVTDPAFMAGARIPCLVIAAGADRVVSTRAIESYTRHLRLASLLTINGARHELLQEADFYREQCLAAFDAFIPGTPDGALEPAHSSFEEAPPAAHRT
jgi:lysophospholipase